jgi:hypothetical protein
MLDKNLYIKKTIIKEETMPKIQNNRATVSKGISAA